MIRGVALSNWKAYSNLQVELQPGTTFVVSQNGIGKSSLLSGISWALFGDRALNAPAQNGIRAGADTATAKVVIEALEQEVSITRKVKSSGRTDVVASFGDETLAGEAEVDALLQSIVEADPDFVARIALVPEGSMVHQTQAGELDLYQHLCRVFRVDALIELTTQGETLYKDSAKRRAAVRRTQARSDQERLALKREIDELESRAKGLEDARRIRQDQAAAAETRLREAALWSQFHADLERYRVEVSLLLSRIEDVVGTSDHGQERDVLSRVAAAANTQRSALIRTEGEFAVTRARLEAVEAFQSELSGAKGVCPVCCRALTPADSQLALHRHQQEIEGLESRASRLERELKELREKSARLEHAYHGIRELPTPVAPTFPEADAADAEEAVRRARQALAEVDAEGLAVANMLGARRAQLQDDDDARARSSELGRLYRDEAVYSAVAKAAATLAASLVQERIDPLATQLMQRWKMLWPDNAGLQISPHGRLFMTRQGCEISFGDFSGGEKVVSLLLVRVLALAMTTRVPFMLLDEPLEHLDPRNRRTVASTLVRMAQGKGLRQIIATTYEEAVARRLADQVRDCTLLYVRGEPA